jgi:general stress protein YciG
MAGNKAGGKKAAAKNIAKDPNFYKNIGRVGGQRGTSGGFASQVTGDDGLTGAERARIAGAKGGRISRRSKKITKSDLSLAA